jgi:hypothetical protein
LSCIDGFSRAVALNRGTQLRAASEALPFIWGPATLADDLRGLYTSAEKNLKQVSFTIRSAIIRYEILLLLANDEVQEYLPMRTINIDITLLLIYMYIYDGDCRKKSLCASQATVMKSTMGVA